MKKYLEPIISHISKDDFDDYSPDFTCLQYDIVDEMEKDNIGFEIVKDIIQLMEKNELVEFGTPGPFTHFIEKFYTENKKEYDKILINSVKEKPSTHTIWLLHRVRTENNDVLPILKNISNHVKLNQNLRNVAKDFLEYY